MRPLGASPPESQMLGRTKWSAPPGYSKHHTGYVLDIAQAGYREFEGTPGHRWVSENGWANLLAHGWVPSYPDGATLQGPSPEPWEIAWVGHDEIACWGRGPLTEDPLCDAFWSAKFRALALRELSDRQARPGEVLW